jgi:plasmid stabilization system protein ParE
MAYRFIIPAGVESRLYDYALYIARDSPARAVAWVDDVIRQMELMVDMPRAHPVAEEESEMLEFEVRKMVLGSYLAFYRVDDSDACVILVDFRHAAQLPRSDVE